MAVKKTSQEWQEDNIKAIVLDPDGWDRINYKYSWFEEEITLEEYNIRVFNSTCVFKH